MKKKSGLTMLEVVVLVIVLGSLISQIMPAIQDYPVVRNGFLAFNLTSCIANECKVIRTDYQANCGSINANDVQGPPPNGVDSYDWRYEPPNSYTPLNGLTHQHSAIRIGQIVDGTSRTIMVGEKYLNIDRYFDGHDPADDNSAYVGMNRDVNGFFSTLNSRMYETVKSDPELLIPSFVILPERDGRDFGRFWTFGSAHRNSWRAVFADGRVATISYATEPFPLLFMGSRNDEICLNHQMNDLRLDPATR